MIDVEVVYASETQCLLRAVSLPSGSAAKDAIQASALAEVFPELAQDGLSVGIFSRPVTMHHVLQAGDRVEIYRPLKMDPKKARRLRAATRS